MKYDKLTNDYAKWLFPLIDRVDCGYKHSNGSRPRFHSNRFLESEGGDYPPREITRTPLQAHLAGDETIYYCSLRSSGFVLAMIDIDAHAGQTDAQAVANWLITAYFEGAYCEPSTGGVGRHVYCLLRVGAARWRDVNGRLARVGEALAELAARQGFSANVCGVYGTFTIWASDADGSKRIERRGAMAKIPRLPDGSVSLSRLQSAPVFLSTSLLPILADAERLRSSALSSLPCTKTSTSELADKSNVDRSAEQSAGSGLLAPTNTSTSEWTDQARVNALESKARTTRNPLARMRYASSLFYLQHGRYAADESELVAFYESKGLHTGDDKHGQRYERATLALDRHKATERARTTQAYVPDDYLPMIRQSVTDAVRTHPAIKYRYPISDDLIAASLYAYTTAASAKNRPDRMHSLSDAGLLAMLKTLAKAGLVSSRFADKEKRVAIRQMLQLAGLIVLRDGEHVHGGRKHGVGDRWGLGLTHARYAEFGETFGHVVDHRSLPAIGAERRAA